jgi:hypothetical protein
MTDAVVFADINAAQTIVNKPSSTNHRHCEYPFRTATKKCKDACQGTLQTASEHATYKKRHCKQRPSLATPNLRLRAQRSNP